MGRVAEISISFHDWFAYVRSDFAPFCRSIFSSTDLCERERVTGLRPDTHTDAPRRIGSDVFRRPDPEQGRLARHGAPGWRTRSPRRGRGQVREAHDRHITRRDPSHRNKVAVCPGPTSMGPLHRERSPNSALIRISNRFAAAQWPTKKDEDRVHVSGGIPGLCDAVVQLYDGHGGKHAARHCILEMAAVVEECFFNFRDTRKYLEDRDTLYGKVDDTGFHPRLDDAVVAAFERLDREIRAEDDSGTTAAVIFLRKGAANVPGFARWRRHRQVRVGRGLTRGDVPRRRPQLRHGPVARSQTRMRERSRPHPPTVQRTGRTRVVFEPGRSPGRVRPRRQVTG